MAIDHWLLEQHRLGLQPPVLRFYTWEPAAISLGYHQSVYPEFWQNLMWHGQPVDLVKRPTGGRAVLHQGDLTYAVIASGLAERRTEAYQQICEFLIQGWRSLGLHLEYGDLKRSYIHNSNCFAIATGADLVTDSGCKFIGSAQLRRNQAILQHGSMRLAPEAELWAKVFQSPAPSPVQFPIPERGEALIHRAIGALTPAAAECFGVEFVTQPLTNSEWQAITCTLKLT